MRVRVPLRTGGRIADGCLVELAESSEYGGTLSELEDVVSDGAAAGARGLGARARGRGPRRGQRERRPAARDPEPVRAGREGVARRRRATPGRLPDAPPRDPRLRGRARSRRASRRASGCPLAADPRPLRLPSGEWVGAWAVTLAQAAAHALAADRSAILVVPDYRDQEQLEAALAASVDPRRVLRTDARQSGGDRYRALPRRDARRAPGSSWATARRSTRPRHASASSRSGTTATPLLTEPLAPGRAPARRRARAAGAERGARCSSPAHTRSVEVAATGRDRLGARGRARAATRSRRSSPPSSRSAPEPRLGAHPLGRVAAGARRPCARARCWCRSRGPATRRRSPATAAGSPRAASRAAARSRFRAAAANPRCVLCGTSAGAWRAPSATARSCARSTVGASRTAEELGRAFPAVAGHPVRRRATRAASRRRAGARRRDPRRRAGRRRAATAPCSCSTASGCSLRESLRVARGLPALVVERRRPRRAGRPRVPRRAWAAPSPRRSRRGSSRTGRGPSSPTRRALRFPPAVRVASVTAPSGGGGARDRGRARSSTASTCWGRRAVDDGLERAIVRFDYAAGTRVARELRAEMIRVATERRRPVGGPSAAATAGAPGAVRRPRVP